MRVKDLWEIFPLPAKTRLFWDRITLTRTTTVYFFFAVLHCVIQVIFQAQAFHSNVLAVDFLASITMQGSSVASRGFYVFGNDLRFCNHAPKSASTSSCQVIWNGTVVNNTVVPTSALSMNTTMTTEDAKNWNQNEQTLSDSIISQRIFPNTIESYETNDTMQIVVDLGWNKQSAIVSEECLWVLGWPVQILRNTEREDVTFIVFQIWVLGMSIVAILNESVPHTIATLFTHLVATAWAGFQIFNTFQFRSDFVEATTNAAGITSLVLNAVALLVSALLSWNLSKSFGWQTFKRIGASPAIGRIYRIVLILSIVTQLSLFFIVTSIALWLDQLWNGAIGHMATSPLYRPFLTITIILLPLWLAFGWYSVRRERKIETFMFLLMCLGYLVGWGAMFDSVTFRWTYMTWTFFGVMTTTSVLLTLFTLILGLICLSNFGKGLPQYLKAREILEEGFEHVIASDPEKVVFPSNNKAATSALGTQVAPQPQMSTQDAALRFAQPVRTPSQKSLQQPSAALTRPPSERTYPFLHRPLHRAPSRTSVDSSVSGSCERTCDDKQAPVLKYF